MAVRRRVGEAEEWRFCTSSVVWAIKRRRKGMGSRAANTKCWLEHLAVVVKFYPLGCDAEIQVLPKG